MGKVCACAAASASVPHNNNGNTLCLSLPYLVKYTEYFDHDHRLEYSDIDRHTNANNYSIGSNEVSDYYSH